MLSVQGVTKLYGDFAAVDNVSLDVQAGEFITLLGPSGSGKTTTLRIIAGFIHPDAGNVMLDGQDITNISPQKRNLGMVFQNYALFPHMTAAENIAFPLVMRHEPKEEVKTRVEAALALVHLEGYGNRKPNQLSGGQQQRIAVARALSFDPRVLLMDEPLGALDKKLREALQLEMIRISRSTGVTVIYVTHDQEEALVMSHRIAIYREGRIEQIGTSDDLYERPVSYFVADFVGQSNTFRGTFRSNGRDEVVTESGVAFSTLDRAGDRVGLKSGDRAAIVVRPERMWVRPAGAVQAGGADDACTILPGQVREVIYLGSDLKCVVDTDAGTVTVRMPAGADSAAHIADPAVEVGWAIRDSVVVTDPDYAAQAGAAQSSQ